MSASLSSIALAWAWSMAIWSRSDSQGHADFGGALHIAQLGSASIVRVPRSSLEETLVHDHDSMWESVLCRWQRSTELGARLVIRWSGTGGDRMHVT
jgi:hypothetical protein